MKITRRTLLKGVLGGAVVSVGLPPLEIFMNGNGTAYANTTADGFPKRFGIFFWGNGVLLDKWNPIGTGSGDAWQLSEQLAAFEAYKQWMTVVSGTRVAVPNHEPHHSTVAGVLTGHPLVMESGGNTFATQSIDQVIASEIGGDTLYPSLEFGAKGDEGLSHNGPHSVNPSEESPFALFERIFGAGFFLPGEEGQVDPTLGLRRSVLDAVMADIQRVNANVGAADAIRLEQHLDGVRTLEKRLAKLQEDPPNFEACAYPNTPEETYEDIDGRPQLQAKNQAMSDMLAMALACDQTRVFSNWFTRPLTNILFQDVSMGHHRLTHDEPSPQPQVNKVVKQCMDGFATMLGSLAAIEEGDGTLLDHCLILGTSDVSNGKNHSEEDFPILLFGGAGGAIKTDYHYRSVSNENTSKVLLSLCNAMGLNRSEFGGEEGYTDTSLLDIEV
jgi:hypothetical protein